MPGAPGAAPPAGGPAAPPTEVSALAKRWAWPDKPALIGTSIKRLDGPDKVSGRAKYTYDINRPGMIYGKIIRSPLPHARVVSVDLTAAQKAPGVKVALVWKDPGTECMFQGEAVAA